jgi:Gnt-I system high-affinity gluconate transporter
VIASIIAAVFLGIPLENIPKLVDSGIGKIMGDLMLILVLGAMLGKLVAESGAAKKIADVMVTLFGEKYMRWALMITGFIVGIPLFFNVGFVLLVPIIFSIVYQYKMPAIYIGLPMIASLSVAHGYLPPHPSPVALISMFNANMGLTLICGIVVAIPAIIIAGPVFSSTLKGIKTGPLKLFEPQESETNDYLTPGKANSFTSATLPVVLLILVAIINYSFPSADANGPKILSLFGAPSIVMLISLMFAVYSLGILQKRPMMKIMNICTGAVKDISPILLIIAGSGIFKQVMEVSGVSIELADSIQKLPLHPLILGWMIAAIIRVSIGSATIAALTAATVMIPLVDQSVVNPNLMVLALGAGSLMFSHVNDSAFWMFKEYFNLSIKDTLRSWSLMETIVSTVGLLGVLTLNMFI